MEEQGAAEASRRMVALEDFQPSFAADEQERAAAVRRYSTLFLADGRGRKGGIGRVMQAENPWGDKLAVKVLAAEASADLTEQDRAAMAAQREAAFRREYESNRLLAGIAGFPKLYGRGKLDGQPAIVMEWVEGQTLEEARRHLSVDDDGRLSPQVAAAIGRDLFDLLSRMALVDGGLVHRDVSPANVMVCTREASLEEQVARGSFDLKLIDFGSTVLPARASSMTVRYGAPQGATPDYAPPEMLTSDVAHVADMRKSPAVDVYAAASVVYLLLCGRPPFELGKPAEHGAAAGEGDAAVAAAGEGGAADGGELVSDYLRKTTSLPQPVRCAHGQSANIAVTLEREGQPADEVRRTLDAGGLHPTDDQLQSALNSVDALAGEIVLAALEADQSVRPSAAEMRDSLADFATLYPENVANALRGKPLLRGRALPDRSGDQAQAESWQRAGRTGRWAALAVALALACVAGFLGSGVRMESLGSTSFGLELGFPLLAALLLGPVALGYLARWRGVRTGAGLARGSAALLVATVAVDALLGAAALSPAASKLFLICASVACSSVAWFGMVFEFALATRPAGR